MVLKRVSVPTRALMPPPVAVALRPELPENVQLVTVNVPAFWMAPPLLVALLPERVQLVSVSVPPLRMAPPLPVEVLPEKVQFVTFTIGDGEPTSRAPPLPSPLPLH